ncbi:hypothetical protein [Coleofasciculus sp. H7-2]|uniref:hypothetical protein n=1 Tax=Coleofasciculus sp. H7-2 TaxID=3351545 RepID=UPI00366FE886
MSLAGAREAELQRVGEVLASWRQGDCHVGEAWFYFHLEPTLPITPEAEEAAMGGADITGVQVYGFAVLTQTCDIVRDCEQRPFIEVAPLVEVDEGRLVEIQRGYNPRYAYIPGIAERRLVADLDRVMTVEKTVIARWERFPGCQTNEETRNFASAASRKRARFAFPNDFNRFVQPLQDRIKKKHMKDSLEGDALRALHEIRVRATPDWDADTIELTFFFIRDVEDVTFQGRNWSSLLELWLGLHHTEDRYRQVYGSVITYDDLTAREYLESDRLDLDHLSLTR